MDKQTLYGVLGIGAVLAGGVGGVTYLSKNDTIGRIAEQVYSARDSYERGIQAHTSSNNGVKSTPSELERECGITFEQLSPNVIDGLSSECRGYVVREGKNQKFP